MSAAASRERPLVHVDTGESFVIVAEPARGRARLPALTDIDAAGEALTVAWAPVANATRATVDHATLTIGPAVRLTPLGELPVKVAGDVATVTVPAGRRLRSLTLRGLSSPAGVIGTGDARLLVSLPGPDGKPQPTYLIPALSLSGVGPPLYAGASYANGVLTLPDPAPGTVRLAVVRGGDAAALAVQPGLTLAGATGLAADPPLDLKVEVGGATLWAAPGELSPGAPDARIDAAVPLAAALDEALAKGAAPGAAVRVIAERPSTVTMGALSVGGALWREEAGPVETLLEGLPVPLGGKLPAPAAEQAAAVTAGLGWRYLGFRLLPDLSDPVPPPVAAVAGLVVGDVPVRRELPPLAMRGEVLGKVGPVGRALAPGKMTVAVLDALTRRALAPPATVALVPSAVIAAPWVEIDAAGAIDGPVTIELAVEGGPFLWVADPQPRLRLAVRDADPGGRALLLDGAGLLAVDVAKGARTDLSWPTARFRGAWPVLSSDLFLAVQMFDLALRYAR